LLPEKSYLSPRTKGKMKKRLREGGGQPITEAAGLVDEHKSYRRSRKKCPKHSRVEREEGKKGN